MPYKNKETEKEYHRNYYQQNKTEIKKRIYTKRKENPRHRQKLVKLNRDFKKRKAIELYENKCGNCGKSLEDFKNVVSVFEFHHLNPAEKDYAIGNFLTHSWDRIKKELSKCVMLCANCHRIEHDRTREKNYLTGNPPHDTVVT